MPDDLARWARERAPELIARAEAEAVAELRRALLAAATGDERRVAAPEAPPARRPPAQGEPGVWAYCVARAGAPLPAGLPGVDAAHPVERIEAGPLAALVSRVPLDEFGEEPLRRNLNDLAWLERVARAHEGILERAMAEAAIVPLRLCTIFDGEDGARTMLAEQQPVLAATLDALDGRHEWAVKLVVDRTALEAAARARGAGGDPAVGAGEPPGSGAAYLLERRRERGVREAADALAAELAHDIHARLAERARDAVRNRPQNRELSGHLGEMLLNGAYLVDAASAERFGALVAELEQRHRDLGARLELTGPLPPYNFVDRVREAPA